jgi:hypothetical protein
MKQNNKSDSALQRTAQWVATHCLPPMTNGMLFAIGFFGTTILAVAISGTITTWTTGQVLKSSDLNTTIASLKTAIEGIPNWTKASNGTDAYYTAGNVGIGTTAPQTAFEIASTAPVITLNRTNKLSGTGEFSIGVENNSQVSIVYDSASPLVIGTSTDPSSTAGFSEKMRITAAGLVGIGRTPTTHPLEVSGSAGLTTGTAWTNISDERLKDIDGAIPSALDNLLKLNPIKYKYNEASGKLFKNADGKSKYGFTAQNVKSVFPEMVITDDKGYLWYNPSGFEAILTSAIKEVAFRLRSTSESVSVVSQKIDSLEKEKAANEKKLLSLEEDNKRLRDRLSKLENTLDEVIAVQKDSREVMAAQVKK